MVSGGRLSPMSKRELLRALKKCGAEVVPNRGAGSHCYVRLNGRNSTVMDREHARSEVKKVLTDLGLAVEDFLRQAA